MEIIVKIVLLIIGFAALIKGADFFVDGASGVAKKFGIPQIIIGLTICAFGTSAPEAAVSINSALNDSAELAIGNVLGSNILNILLILGITSLIRPLKMQITTYKYEVPYVMFSTILLAVIGVIGEKLNFVDGIILWMFMILFLVYLFRLAKKGNSDNSEETDENTKPKPVWLLIVLIILGCAMIVIGSDLTVDSASFIATKLGMTERLIGLTIVAFGTSLPELVTSVIAAKKGNSDIAIGNIVGSNIFNILFILGTTALITDTPFASNFILDSVIALAATVILFVLASNKKKELTRKGGIIMLISYAVYFIYLLMA